MVVCKTKAPRRGRGALNQTRLNERASTYGNCKTVGGLTRARGAFGVPSSKAELVLKRYVASSSAPTGKRVLALI